MKTVTVDFTGLNTPESVHHALFQALSFPEYYGNNFDALFDCLTELDEDVALTLRHFPGSDSPLGSWGETLMRVFCCAAEENPGLHITVD